jgi:hypothetical protein
MRIQISWERCRRACNGKERLQKLTMMWRLTRSWSSASSSWRAPAPSPPGSSFIASDSDEDSERGETSPRRPRQRSPYHSNKASLPNHLQRQLLQEIESSGGISELSSLTLAKILDSKPDVYGKSSSNKRRSVRDRVRYWRDLPIDEYYRVATTLGFQHTTPQSASTQSSPEYLVSESLSPTEPSSPSELR